MAWRLLARDPTHCLLSLSSSSPAVMEVLMFGRDASMAEAWLSSQEPIVRSAELGSNVDEVENLIKRHEGFQKSVAAWEERFLALEKLTTVSGPWETGRWGAAFGRLPSFPGWREQLLRRGPVPASLPLSQLEENELRRHEEAEARKKRPPTPTLTDAAAVSPQPLQPVANGTHDNR